MHKNNKYVDFVSDEHILECVKYVCLGYVEARGTITIKDLKNNGIDPFKTIFDISNKNMTFNSWLKQEEERQMDKTLNNKIGEFHQLLLGGVKYWEDLGIGDESKLDIIKSDKSIVLELKNKENTVNSDSKDKVRDKLEKFIKNHPKSVAYWAYIINKKNSSGEKIWIYKKRKDKRIRRIWGSKVYETITGDPQALKDTWIALPIAIKDLLGKNISKEDMQKLLEAFQDIF